MDSRDSFELGTLELSAVHEMANIGLGHATTALAGMTSHPFTMSIPSVETTSLTAVPQHFGGPEAVAMATHMEFEGDAEGWLTFLMPWSSGVKLLEVIVGTSPATPWQISELETSALLEVGNIVNGSFLNAISDMTGLRLLATPPWVSIEMAGAAVSTVLAEAEQKDAFALSVQTSIRGETTEIEGTFLCIPTVESLNTLMVRLGLREAA